MSEWIKKAEKAIERGEREGIFYGAVRNYIKAIVYLLMHLATKDSGTEEA